MPMQRFYSDTSSEFKAQEHIKSYIYFDSTLSPQTMGECAAYAAVLRWVTRSASPFEYPIRPTSVKELKVVLFRHALDVIHSLISQTRASLPPNGYSTAKRLAEESLTSMLQSNDNAWILLDINNHLPFLTTLPAEDDEDLSDYEQPPSTAVDEKSADQQRIMLGEGRLEPEEDSATCTAAEDADATNDGERCGTCTRCQ